MRRSVACDKPALGGGIQRLKIRLLFVGQLFFFWLSFFVSLFSGLHSFIPLFFSLLFLSFFLLKNPEEKRKGSLFLRDKESRESRTKYSR